jgi:hypothetical protein
MSKKGTVPWNKGLKMPEEFRAKLRRPKTEEEKEKNRLAHLGKKASEKTKRLQGDSHRGSKRSEETKERQRLAAIKRWEDEEARQRQSEKAMGRKLSLEIRNKISKSKTGKKMSAEVCRRESERFRLSGNPRWLGGKSYDPYCPKFNNPLKRSNRETFHGECQFPGCGITKEENGGRELSVHHVFTEKMACCETKIEEIEQLRKRLPIEVARFGEPNFTEEELMYIRMIIPLCNKHHGMIRKESDDTPFEETMYRKYFTVLIMGKHNGICYSKQISAEA